MTKGFNGKCLLLPEERDYNMIIIREGGCLPRSGFVQQANPADFACGKTANFCVSVLREYDHQDSNHHR